MIKKIFLPLILLAVSYVSQASDIVAVKPLTDKILMVHFDDGYAIHHKIGEPRASEQVVTVPLNVEKAMATASYTRSSANDAAYTGGKAPVDVGRKSKPTEFALMCQQYDNGCVNSDPDHAKEHWLYLYLPSAMQSGKSYTLTTDNLAEHDNQFTFEYNEAQLHSEAIHVNNIGYSTTAPARYGYLYHWAGDKGSLDLSAFLGKEFKLYDVDKNTFVFTGSIAFRKPKTNPETGQTGETPNANFAAADVYECDFSDFATPGNYRLVVPGMGSSFEFALGPDAYSTPFYWAMKGLYQNRSGIALKEPYTNFPRAAPHHPGQTPGFAGKLKYSSFRAFDMQTHDGVEADKAAIEAQYQGVLEDTYGWYQDAGDWDGYYTHTQVPAYLLFLYESGPQKFSDSQLNIPESGNNLPDVLDEGAWLLRYFKRAKDEIQEKGWGTGGVPGARVFGDLWGEDAPGDIGQGSWQDVARDWYVLGEDPWTSFKYAAMAAQLAYILQQANLTDPEGVDWQSEAENAYDWAVKNRRTDDANHTDIANLRHTWLYAATSLYRLTGKSYYHDHVYDHGNQLSNALDPSKPELMFAAWMYMLTTNHPRYPHIVSDARMAVRASSDKFLTDPASRRACRWGGDYYFPMLVGQPTTPMVTPGVFGYLVNKNATDGGTPELKYLHTTADYFLGCNPLNMTWISGVGERYPVGLFHLDWWYSGQQGENNRFPVIEGVIPYGPWRVSDMGPLGWWNPNWAYSDVAGNPRIYPEDVAVWPGHERWFDIRNAPLNSEFTIHQNTVVAAFVYGFLTEGPSIDIAEGTAVVTGLTKDKLEPSTVKLYANPASEQVTVAVPDSLKIVRLEIWNQSGQRLQFMQYEQPKNAVTVTTDTLASGMYFLQVTLSNNQVQTKKLLVQQ